MKRIVTSLLCPLMGVLLMASCLENDDETDLSSDVALLSFSIKDLKTTHTIKKENGEDSTYTTVVSSKSVKFVIDQEQRIVYNSDSILFGTDVTHVLVNVTADGGVCYKKSEDEFGSIEDSIDFTHPVVFRVTSNDERFVRDYTVSINVRQTDPQKTAWKELDEANFPANLFAEQKAFVKNDSLIVVGKDADGAYHTASAALANATAWATTACNGIQCRAEGLSVLLAGETFYLTADTVLYRSTDGVTWDSVTVTPSPLTLLAVEDAATPLVWGVGDEGFMSSSDMVTWNTIGQYPANAIKGGVASFCQPLRTNENINRTLFVAMPEGNGIYAQVWTKLSTEDSWVEVVPGTNIYGCPNLQNLAVIAYADNLYAFGGNRKEPIKSFDTCYESRDHGVTWKENANAFSLPAKFEGRIGTFSAVTDGEYVWVMWSNGQVWRGRWNGIE